MKTFNSIFKERSLPVIIILIMMILGSGSGITQDCSANLLVNPDASEGFNGWTITAQSGSGWNAAPAISSFRTSYGSCPEYTATHAKHQIVDLVAAGFSPEYLDSQPVIEVGESVVAAFRNTFCDAYNGQGFDNYFVRYEIWDANNNVLASYNSGTPANPELVSIQPIKESMTFSEYGAGARYVFFEHGGADSGFWNGWYGANFSDLYVNVAYDCAGSIVCPDDVKILNLDGYIGAPSITSSDAASCCEFPQVTYTDTYIVEDACSPIIEREWRTISSGGGSICRQRIEVLFNCGLTCPVSTCVDMDSDYSPEVLGSPRAIYDCDLNNLSYTDHIQSECEGVDQVLRTWTSSFTGSPDCYRSCTQIISFNDGTAPVLANCPEDRVVSTSCQEVHWAEPIASDNCIRVSLSSDHQPGDSFDHGNTMVTYTARDGCGNTATCSFNILVENEMAEDCSADLVVDYSSSGINWPAPQYSGDCTACPPAKSLRGYRHLGSFAGSDYYLTRNTYDYADSRSKAITAGGHLATITSQEENDFLSRAVYPSAWIGLADADSEGDFHWHSGEDMTYSNWFQNQPNNSGGTQHYVELLGNGEWNDADDKRSFSILEIPCSNVVQTKGPASGSVMEPGTYEIQYTIADGCDFESCCSFMLTVSDPVQGLVTDDELFLTTTLEEEESTLENSSELPVESLKSPIVVQEEKLLVFPNPASHDLNLRGLGDENFEVYNMNGNIVIQKSSVNKLNIAHLDAGFYILRTETNRVVRFVKI